MSSTLQTLKGFGVKSLKICSLTLAFSISLAMSQTNTESNQVYASSSTQCKVQLVPVANNESDLRNFKRVCDSNVNGNTWATVEVFVNKDKKDDQRLKDACCQQANVTALRNCRGTLNGSVTNNLPGGQTINTHYNEDCRPVCLCTDYIQTAKTE